jgi:mono/diheme cytochrome c family protein
MVRCERKAAALGVGLLSVLIGCTDEQADAIKYNRPNPPNAEADGEFASPAGQAPQPTLRPGQIRPPTAEDLARAAAPPAARQPDSINWSGGDPGKGHEIYGRYCELCHGPDGTGQGPGAAALNPKPRDFTIGRFYIDANANNKTGEDIDLARVIREGTAAFGASPAMPGWTMFSEAQVRDLVAYVRQLSESRPAPSR